MEWIKTVHLFVTYNSWQFNNQIWNDQDKSNVNKLR
jgi:hypothetical protein